ncbi:MAG: mechanosensitive ion channel family protein [Bacteroidales bacterium]
MDVTLGFSDGDDIDKARKALEQIVYNDPRILKEPAEPMIAVQTLNDSSVDLLLRIWLKTEDFWDFHWEIREKAKKAFDKEGITIPFPQRDVHFYQNEKKYENANIEDHTDDNCFMPVSNRSGAGRSSGRQRCRTLGSRRKGFVQL